MQNGSIDSKLPRLFAKTVAHAVLIKYLHKNRMLSRYSYNSDVTTPVSYEF